MIFEMFYFTNKTQINWGEFTLVVPSVSVGNVGQLTCDLLISTNQMTKIGYIYDDSILPMVGNDPFSPPTQTSCNLVTSCEIYVSEKDKLVLIQQRAPFVKGKQVSFRQKLVSWIKSCGFNQVLILTSSFAHERLDKQLAGPQQRFLASAKMEEKLGPNVRETLKWTELEKRLSFPAPSSIETTNGQNEGSIYIPGGGIAKKLYEDCCKDMAVLVLLTFCSEGDNGPDAINLANFLNEYLKLTDVQPVTAGGGGESNRMLWKVPSSWRLAFGSRPDPMLFH